VQLDGTIDMEGHTPVHIEDLLRPRISRFPRVSSRPPPVQGAFAKIYSNPYEIAGYRHINLHVTLLNERRWATIDSAWIEKSEVHPGEQVSVKVMLRPYRGAPFIQITDHHPAANIARHSSADAERCGLSDRNTQSLTMTSGGELPGLEELIKVVNRERRNDHLYASLLQSTPTILVEDKEMPNVPASESTC